MDDELDLLEKRLTEDMDRLMGEVPSRYGPLIDKLAIRV